MLQGYYTTSLWSGQMNLVKSTDHTRMVISHRGGMELLDAGISVVVYAQRNGVRYADYSINVEHVFELYGQLEIENVIDIDELKMDSSPYLIDGAVWVRIFVRPHSIFGAIEQLRT